MDDLALALQHTGHRQQRPHVVVQDLCGAPQLFPAPHALPREFVGDFKASASLGWCPVCIEKTITKHVEKKFED